MFSWLKRKLGFYRALSKPQKTNDDNFNSSFSSFLDVKLSYLKTLFQQSPDVIIREFNIGKAGLTKAAVVFVDGLADKEAIEERVMKPLIIEDFFANIADTELNTFEAINKHLLLSAETKKADDMDMLVDGILNGETALLIDGINEVLLISYFKWQQRSIQEPDTEKTITGPKEGFIETLRVNTALLRRKIRDPNLVLEMTTIGVRTKTPVCIAYIKGIARPEIVEELKRRLKEFAIDGVLSAGYLEELVTDSPFSPFRTIGTSEKPDRVAAKLLEGRIAVIVDGTPFVLTLPALFIENFQSTEDYHGHFIFQSALRLLRFLAFFLSVVTLPLYVGLASFHHELLPTKLALSLIAARIQTPFPSLIEALILSLFFEILREAGIRMPTAVGGAVNIVGALVLGDAAVRAGLVGAPMVIIIALTAIANFVIPSLLDTVTLLRYFYLFLVGIYGLFGLGFGIIVTIIHLCSLYSFGIPYLSPIAPFLPSQMKDTFLRYPFWKQAFRPWQLAVDKKRGVFRLDHLKKKDEND